MTRRGLLLGAAAALKAREPRKLAELLARVYGQAVTEPVYTQTFALLGRLRLGQDVKPLMSPFAGRPIEKLTASHLSGGLIYTELGFAEAALGLARQARVELYNEMSDGVFMGPPLLARVGLAEDAIAHWRAIEGLCLRADGLYRHSPLCEAAWGRGNAFPALGLALTLEGLPKRPPDMVAAFQKLCQTLARYQSSEGMWRQVIDEESSYFEYSATAMIGAAMQKGLRRGWLKGDPYRTCVREAYTAIDLRTRDDGGVEGVCESTGKQRTLEAYLSRRAITGLDGRGGAMGLYFATEMLR